MFDAHINRGIPELRNAVGIISSVGNSAMVVMTAAGFSIQVSDELGLAAELRLNRAACQSYRFQPVTPANYEYIFINLTRLRDFLEQATEGDALHLSRNPLRNDDREHRLRVILVNPAVIMGRSLDLEAIYDLLQVPSMIADETRYMVTAVVPSLQFRDIMIGLRYFIDENGHITDNYRPVWITLTAAMMVFRVAGLEGVTLRRSRGELAIQGAAFGDVFPLWFDLANLEALNNATQMSGNVLVHVDVYPNRRPLLNCPFGNGLGNLFFFGNRSTPMWWSYFYE